MPRGKMKFSEQDMCDIIDMYREGCSTKHIAARYFVCAKTIRLRLKEWGEWEDRTRSHKYPKHKRFMIAGLRMNGVSNKALAEQYHISEATVKNYVIEYKEGL